MPAETPTKPARHIPRANASLEALVPLLVRRRLARAPAAPREARAECVPAALLFADISGFSAAAERLARRGTRGAEDLKDLLNQVFGRLVDLIDAHGGEVLKFPGDAVIALWPNDAGDAERRAARCALVAGPLLDGIALAGGAPLRLRIGIGSGTLTTATVGGLEGRWEVVAAGPPLDGALAALAAARPGEVVVAPDAWAALSEVAQGDALTAGGHLLRRIAEPPALPPAGDIALPGDALAGLQAFVPRFVRARLEAGQTDWLAEFRRVSALFVGIDGIDYAAADAMERLQVATVAVQRAVHRHGGSVLQLVADDKGTVAVCAWGLAESTHGDDAVRAVQAAAELHRALADAGFGAACGIATGDTFSGMRGNAKRAEFAIIGSVVNLAARLMQAAKDGVLCDVATRDAARRRVSFDALAPIHAKGRDEPVEVFRPGGGERSNDATGARLVGREAERTALAARIDAATASRGGVVVIEGDAGMGKSTLVAHTVAAGGARGLRAFVARGDAIERASAYHPWLSTFEELLGLAALGPAERAREVTARIASAPRLAPFTPLLAPVLRLGIEETDHTRQVTPAGRAHLTRDLLAHLFADATRGTPILLVLDDAHWFDSASWALAEALAARRAGCLLVVSMRPLDGPERAPELNRLARADGAVTLRLGALSADETRELVRARVGADVLDEPVARFLLDKADGHPFFTEELVTALRDGALIQVADGTCRFTTAAAAAESLRLPDTVQGVITSRIDTLSPAEQLTLKVASVLGHSFDLATLAAVYPVPCDRATIARHVEVFAQRDLAHAAGADGGTGVFRHAVTLGVAYGLLPFAQRRQLHGAVASTLEHRHAADLAAVYALLAHHWGRAEQADKAVVYLGKAADQSFGRYANEEAVRFYSELLDADRAPPGAARIGWGRKMGEALMNLGRWDDAYDRLGRTLRDAGRPIPATAREWRIGILRELLVQFGHRLAPWSIRSAADGQDQVLLDVVRAYQRLGGTSYYKGRHKEMLFALLSALNVSERRGTSHELALAYADIGNIWGVVPVHALARSYGDRACRMAEVVGGPATGRIIGRTCVYRAAVGDPTARGDLERALALADRFGDAYLWLESGTLFVRLTHMHAEYARSGELAAELVARATATATDHYLVLGLNGLAWVALHGGLNDAAAAEAERALELGAARREKLATTDGHGLLALAHFRRGDAAAARRHADSALEIAESGSSTAHFVYPGMAAAAEAYFGLLESERTPSARAELHARLARCVRSLGRLSRINPPARANVLLWDGCLQSLAGRTAQAQRRWRRAMAEADRFDLPFERARARLELGRSLPVADSARHTHLQAAVDAFRQLGMPAELARAEAVVRDS